MKKLILPLIASILMLNLISSTITCSPSSVSYEYKKGDSIQTKSIQCSNDANVSVSLSKTGNFLTIDQTIIGQAPSSKTIVISFDSTTSPGNFFGTISFNDGSASIPIFFIVTENTLPSCTLLDIFPVSLSNIKVVQGEQKSRNIQISVPNCYNSSVNLNGVSLQSDEKPIILGELSLGKINPGNSIMIPIEIDARSVSTGQYSDTLLILAYTESGTRINVPSVSISVLVTQGIQPIQNFSLSDLPSCSLDTLNLNLNSSYKLTCSVNNPNIEIHPLIDSKYIKGLSVSETPSQYIYNFQPILIGETSIGAEFLYKNAQLGSPFQQEVRIISGGVIVSGTSLKALFYQDGIRKEITNLNSGLTTLVIIDNKTNSIINDYTILIGGQTSNNTFLLSSNKVYDFLISSSDYLSLAINFSVLQSSLSLKIEPEKAFYEAGDVINLISDINDTRFLLNEKIISSPHTLISTGNFTIKAIKEDYTTINKTIEVRGIVSLNTCSPLPDDWKKGKEIICEINKEEEWAVYKNSELVNSGKGTRIEFKIEDNGDYELRAGDKSLLMKKIESRSVMDSIKGSYLSLIVTLILLILIIYFIFFRGREEESGMGFGANINPNQ